MSSYLFDTYAIMEIVAGNKNYNLYLDEEIIINNFIFAELCYNLFKDKIKNSEEILEIYAQHISSVKPAWIKEAMRFRLNWKGRNISIPDCIGYVMAKNLDIKFLTGDKEFKDLENVEFVK